MMSPIRHRGALGKGAVMKNTVKDFRVTEGDTVNLRKWPSAVDPVYKSKQQYRTLLPSTSTASAICNSCFTHPTPMRCW